MLSFSVSETEEYKKMMPCVKNKCIKLPICKQKSIVKCDDLLKFQQEIQLLSIKKTGSKDMINGIFDSYVVINEILPRVYGIEKEYNI